MLFLYVLNNNNNNISI